MSFRRRQLTVLVLVFAASAPANPKCANVLARAYAGYSEGSVHMVWAASERPRSSLEPHVLVDELEEAATDRANAHATAIRRSLDLEEGGSAAFAAHITPVEQQLALVRDPMGGWLHEAWRAAGWELSAPLRERGFGMVVRNGVPRELHVGTTSLPFLQGSQPGSVYVVGPNPAIVRGLLSRFPTVRRIVGLSETEALVHFAYVACFGHPGGVFEVERVLSATPPVPAHVKVVVTSIFRWWRDQPQGLDGPSNVTYPILQALEHSPGQGPRLAAWIRGEPATEADFFGESAVFDLLRRIFDADHLIVRRFDDLYASLPAARKRVLLEQIRVRRRETGTRLPFASSRYVEVTRAANDRWSTSDELSRLWSR